MKGHRIMQTLNKLKKIKKNRTQNVYTSPLCQAEQQTDQITLSNIT